MLLLRAVDVVSDQVIPLLCLCLAGCCLRHPLRRQLHRVQTHRGRIACACLCLTPPHALVLCPPPPGPMPHLPHTQIPGIGKVTEQTLQALGVSTCSDLIAHAALLTALLSDISSSSLIQAGLGLGSTQHSSRASGGGEGGEPGRKGISCERTFGAMSLPGDMEQMVRRGMGVGKGLQGSLRQALSCWYNFTCQHLARQPPCCSMKLKCVDQHGQSVCIAALSCIHPIPEPGNVCVRLLLLPSG